MGTKISETLSLAGGNLARPTRFSILIAPPPAIVNNTDSKVFDVLCKSVEVPETTMEPIDMIIKGHTVKIPGRVNQIQTINLTMYLDEHHLLRQMFADWIAGMDNRFYGTTSVASVEIAKNKTNLGNLIIKVRDFNETTNEPMNYLFEGIYPISVGGPVFDGADLANISELTVTLGFYRFLSGDTSGAVDNMDEYLSVFGLEARDLASLGQIGTSISAGINALDSVNSAIDSVASIGRALNNLF